MNIKRILSIILLFLVILAIIPSLCFAEERKYTINQADIDLYVHENGLLHVKEHYYYSFSGTYHGIYRDIPLSGNQDMKNINISVQGAYYSYEIINNSNYKTIRVYLFSNPGKSIPVTDKNVQVVMEYDFINAIKIYNDIGELHYKLWGEYWNADVNKINAKIHLPNTENIKYWTNPPYYVDNSSFSGTTLYITSKKITHRNYLELRVAIPLNEFKTPIYGERINSEGLAEIESVQNAYNNKLNHDALIYQLVALLMIISVIIPVFIYLKYGREPKINNELIYEREPPSNDPPVFINAISGKSPGKPIGTPDIDGFLATILDLINREYLIQIKYVNSNKNKPIELMITRLKDINELQKYERDVLDILSKYTVKGNISLDKMNKELKNKYEARSFKKDYDSWRIEVKSKFFSDNKLEKFYRSVGNGYMEKYGIVAIIVAMAVFFRSACDPAPYALYGILGSLILGLAGILSLIMPYKVAGQWTKYGAEYDAHWKNFMKFLSDYSIIKEHPPESLTIWNQYLVYATALGVADEVSKIMGQSLPEALQNSGIFLFHAQGGYYQMYSAFNTGIGTAIQAASGPGGPGGGVGGGGGGAF